MTWKVEPIAEADIEDLHGLFSNAGPYISARTLSDYWLYARLFSSTCLCVRDDTNKPIAAIIAFRDQTKDVNEIYIQDVAVESSKRSMGLAQAIMRELHNIASDWNVTRIWLTSEAENTKALRVWKTLGYINSPSHYEDSGVWLTRDLKGPGRNRAMFEYHLDWHV